MPVLLALPLAGVLDYAVPPEFVLEAGDIVQVPLRGRLHYGVVWDESARQHIDESKLRFVTEHVPGVRIDRSLRRLVEWLAAYTMCAPGDAVSLVLRPSLLKPVRQPAVLHVSAAFAEVQPLALTPARRRVLAVLGQHAMPATALAEAAKASIAVIRGMLKANLLIASMVPKEISHHRAPIAPSATLLSEQQQVAAQMLVDSVTAGGATVTLLQGATGSGKTEVYFAAVEQCLALGKQALILIPEIALSAQWLDRYRTRFGMDCAVWHSDLSEMLRRRHWRDIASGAVNVVVGARSALFLSFRNLGLIIVDEEHEAAFKQEDRIIYNARDMAVVRGRLASVPVILVSATPSLETVTNAIDGRYRRIVLAERFGGAQLPEVHVVDMRAHSPARGRFLSPVLIDPIKDALARGEQVLLFLNRRGYAPLTLCRACGYRVHCPNCTAWLVWHRARAELACHHCGFTISPPSVCPSCDAAGSFVAVGPGVERITEEVAALLPDTPYLVMSSDTLTSSGAAASAAQSIIDHEVGIIIGTQVVAKGWHFPDLTLVCVVDADLGLSGSDLRASERCFQLLQQVGGRAGRSEKAGRVYLQTYQPDHPVIHALIGGDFDAFMTAEAAQRRFGKWPPFGRLAALIISSTEPDAAEMAARQLGREAPTSNNITILGPAPAPLAVLRGRHRWRLLMRTPRDLLPQPLISLWLAKVKLPRSVKLEIDIDPLSFL